MMPEYKNVFLLFGGILFLCSYWYNYKLFRSYYKEQHRHTYPVFRASSIPKRGPVLPSHLFGEERLRKYYNNVCAQTHTSMKGGSNLPRKVNNIFKDILLVVIYMRTSHNTMPQVELLYSQYFPHIVYCIPAGPKPMPPCSFCFDEKNTTKPKENIFFYENTYVLVGGHFYDCLQPIARRSYAVSGYLVISDDVLVNIKDMERIYPILRKQDAIYIPHPPNGTSMQMYDLKSHTKWRFGKLTKWTWAHWPHNSHQGVKVLAEYKEKALTSEKYHTWLNALKKATGGVDRIMGGYADIFYIPTSQVDSFLELSVGMLKNGIFFEIAVPTIAACLSARSFSSLGFTVKVIRSKERHEPWLNFPANTILNYSAYHPIKFSYIENSNQTTAAAARNFFCKSVIPQFYKVE